MFVDGPFPLWRAAWSPPPPQTGGLSSAANLPSYLPLIHVWVEPGTSVNVVQIDGDP